MSLANRHGDVLPADDIAVAQGLCDTAALTLAHWPAEARRPHDLLTSLQAAVSAKATVEPAKGLVAEYAGFSLKEALVLLRLYAEKERLPMTTVARAPAERMLGPEELLEGVPGRA
ncbi:ANTAR domain-containing protein [Streptomyces sp. AC555_RSS877]|uniref:ANTAR domain-containing protein n=1 Tax=Streptomyces sp. AC555_RSS877 TaxID=2823688 RepID=UPI001C27A912|nr:ANTAR domain-containing protein [Streptomyces sp. AC555_RSS877]